MFTVLWACKREMTIICTIKIDFKSPSEQSLKGTSTSKKENDNDILFAYTSLEP